MPSVYDLKPKFQNLLRPIADALVRGGVTANQVTIATLALSLVTGGVIALWPEERWPLLVLPAALFLRMALNAIDGMMARDYGMQSARGALLNELGDVLADTAMYLPLALVPGFDPRLVVAIVVLAVMSEMTGVIGVQIGASRRYDGPSGKSDRAAAFALVSLLLGLGVPAGWWVNALLALIAVLLLVTIFNRARAALREVSAKDRPQTNYPIHPLAGIIATMGRLLSGVQVRWEGARPEPRQRIYFANHTSHLDFVVLWAVLPRELRARTRPVAAKDYWEKGVVRPYLAQRVFRAVLLERGAAAPETEVGASRVAARDLIARLVEALGTEGSLIVFPEGTRGTGETVAPFKSGIYHLARHRPDVELVPVYINNLNRILPKGEVLPVPLLSTVTFGAPMHLTQGETKMEFLDRAREAVCRLRRT